MRFSLVIPCFNEEKNIPLLIERCKFIGQHDEIELVLVDNGSIDNTANVIKDFQKSLPYLKLVSVKDNLGYGYGILKGLEQSKGEILGWTHADMQTDPQDILKGLELFYKDKTVNFVKGRRVKRPFKDNFFTIGMSIFESLLLLKPMYDINAQPTMFSRDLFENWDSPPYDFSLDLYAYYMAMKKGYHIKRFKVFFNDRAFGESNWNISWQAKWKFIMRTIRYSIKLKRSL